MSSTTTSSTKAFKTINEAIRATDAESQPETPQPTLTFQNVELTHAKDKVWLVKIPEAIKEAWDKIPAGQPLGSVL